MHFIVIAYRIGKIEMVHVQIVGKTLLPIISKKYLSLIHLKWGVLEYQASQCSLIQIFEFNFNLIQDNFINQIIQILNTGIMEAREKKIAEDLNQLITNLNREASQQFREEIKTYSKKVLNSLMGRNNIEDPLILKDKILSKVQNNHDSRGVLQCQESLNRFLNSNSSAITKRPQILKVLLKVSDDVEKSSDNFDSIFNERQFKPLPNLGNTTLNQTQQSFNTSSLPQTINNNSFNQSLKLLRYRGSIEQQISQLDILTDLVFIFQNMEGKYISMVDGMYILNPKINVTQPVRRMVTQLSEIGILYGKITQQFTEEGVIIKALNLAVKQELQEYYRWLAIIQANIKSQELTLRKLLVWSWEPLETLKYLTSVLQAVRPYTGCCIISIVNSYRPQGSNPIYELLNRLLGRLLEPLFHYIKNWIYFGELIDAKRQFFISQVANVPDEWNDKYSIIRENIPNIIDEETADMIFNIGKSIYFLRNKCKSNYTINKQFFDTTHILQNKIHESVNLLSKSFKEWVISVYNDTNKELVTVLFENFKLHSHLDAMKKFFLIGQGNFTQSIADSLKDELSKPKHQIYEYNLQGYIVQAMKYCFPESKREGKQSKFFRQHITSRLVAKKVDHGSDGWDVFNFQYIVDDPINIILSKQMMMNYQKIFHFLWRVKRIQQGLKEIWFNHAKNEYNKDKQIKGIFHQCHLLRNAMTHFLNNLYGYLMIAIESVWDEFMIQLRNANSFDEILSKHRQVVQKIIQITLNNPKSKAISQALSNLFISIQSFRNYQITLFEQFSDYFQKKRQYKYQIQLDKKGINSQKINKSSFPTFTHNNSSKVLKETNALYYHSFKTFFDLIKKDSDGLGVLAFRLDFSQYYSEQMNISY